MPDDANALTLTQMAEAIANSPLGQRPLVHWDTGPCVIDGIGVYSEPPGDDKDCAPGFAVAVSHMAQGDVFGVHVHPGETEHLLIGRGVLEVTKHDGPAPGTYALGPHEHIRIEPGTRHSTRALSPVSVVGMTIPADRGYPDARGYVGHVRDENGEHGSDE